MEIMNHNSQFSLFLLRLKHCLLIELIMTLIELLWSNTLISKHSSQTLTLTPHPHPPRKNFLFFKMFKRTLFKSTFLAWKCRPTNTTTGLPRKSTPAKQTQILNQNCCQKCFYSNVTVLHSTVVLNIKLSHNLKHLSHQCAWQSEFEGEDW